MTVDVARRRTRRSTKITSPSAASPLVTESLSIGEIEPTVFSCPNCQRPLAIGARQCPGCKTRLIARVQFGKASLFVAFGVAVGLAIGGAVGTAAIAAGNASRDAEVQSRVAAALAAANVRPAAVATTSPVASNRPIATAVTGGGGVAVPPLAQSALNQAATVDAQLAAAAPVLRSALAAKTFDTYTVFQVLRSVSEEAVAGRQLAAHIGDWSGGTELGPSLAAYYSTLQESAGQGLDASIRNAPAYKAAAREMLKLLEGLGPVDAQLRSVAEGAGVTIPDPKAP
ncbi:MAG: hypothetical protein ACJ77D_12145 [Chloroflexota bacterium]